MNGAGTLVERLRAGDETAYVEAMERYGPRMLATARRILQDEAAAEDCVQEAFLNAFRTVEGFAGRSDPGTWLHRIVINAALQRKRSRARRPERSIEPLLPGFDDNGVRLPTQDDPDDPEDAVDRRHTDALVRRKIDELPETYRVVLLLRDIEERSTSDVAALLDIKESTVKMRLHRARGALRTLLAPLLAEGGGDGDREA